MSNSDITTFTTPSTVEAGQLWLYDDRYLLNEFIPNSKMGVVYRVLTANVFTNPSLANETYI